MKLNIINEHIRTVENFWSKEKCESFIKQSEEIGYKEALVNTGFGHRRVSHIRNNKRVIHDNVELAEQIWGDLEPFAHERIGNSFAIGLNERFRFYRYEKGQMFRKHKDLSYIRNPRESSYYTFMIYLNDNYSGGTTAFKDVEIIPRQGMCLIFYHSIEHEGTSIDDGIKYILRTDIMYKINSKL